MPNYIVNINASTQGVHEVHNENSNCPELPHHDDRRSLGWFSTCQGAVAEAKKTYASAEGCQICTKL